MTNLAQTLTNARGIRMLTIPATVEVSDAEDIANRIMRGRAIRAYSATTAHVFTLYKGSKRGWL